MFSRRWQECLDALRADPFTLADQLDWVAKLKLMESYRARDELGWDAPKLALIDLQYADVDPRRSLYAALVAKGKIRRLIGDDEIERARNHPPEDTRAYFRGRVMEKFGAAVVAASWDSVIFDVPDRPALQRIPLLTRCAERGHRSARCSRSAEPLPTCSPPWAARPEARPLQDHGLQDRCVAAAAARTQRPTDARVATEAARRFRGAHVTLDSHGRTSTLKVTVVAGNRDPRCP